LSYCLKAVGFYHGAVVTRATPELTYSFAAYTTPNSFSVNTRGVARAAGLLAQQCQRHLEALQYTQPPLSRR
jgi:hypothetical protein